MSEADYLWPAEWEEHSASWLAWPHNLSDWLGNIEPVFQTYLSIIQQLQSTERVELICENREACQEIINKAGINSENLKIHQVPSNRSWLRDSLPTFVRGPGGEILLVTWKFNAWARYDDYVLDQELPQFVASTSKLNLVHAKRLDAKTPLVLEGGAIETDGKGSLLVTEECLLSEVQQRNFDCSQEEYERLFAKYLGISKTIWLKAGIPGDDTHGHIDDLARFVAPTAVLLAYDKQDPLFAEISATNLSRLKTARNSRGETIEAILLPMPNPIEHNGERLPASYANFYIANKKVLVPVFKQKSDDLALRLIDNCFPKRETIPIDCRHFIIGQGAIHCATQQQPA